MFCTLIIDFDSSKLRAVDFNSDNVHDAPYFNNNNNNNNNDIYIYIYIYIHTRTYSTLLEDGHMTETCFFYLNM
jgi:hypothetical protein